MRDAEYSDETLLQLVAQQDVNALETLYDRHVQITYSLIKRIVREPAIADEVLQETFLQIWRKAGDFRGQGSAAAWFNRIARNKSLDQLRSQKARPQPMTTTLADEQLDGSISRAASTNVEQDTERALVRQRLRQALTDLPVEQRLCVELAYFEGLTQHEIATHVGIPVGTVKTRIRLGIEKLERMLRAAGLEVEDVEA